MSLYILMYRRLFGVPDVIKDMTRSLEMVRHEDRYIGQLYLDTGKVPGEIGTIPELREVIGTPQGK